MRILHITPSFQHPTMRGPTRHYHFLRELSRRNQVTLLTLARGPVTDVAMAEISSYAERVLTFGTHGAANGNGRARHGLLSPLAQELELRGAVGRMRAAFRELVRREPFDVVFFHGKHLFPVIASTRLPVVADFCDATSMRKASRIQYSPTYRKPMAWLRYQEVRRLENRLRRKTPHLAFISERDRDAVLGSRVEAEVVPNGVDHRYWSRTAPAPGGNCIIFTGVMDYAPNADAAGVLIDDIMPRLRATLPDLELLIVGRDPTPELQARARQVPGVHVTGTVEDVRPWLERAAVFVAPLRYGSGMQNKVLEALAMQVPVVTTPVVAAGLCTGGAEAPLRVAADADAFAAATARLLGDHPARAALAAEGRRFVESHFSWETSALKLERMCLTAVGRVTSSARPDRLGTLREVAL
jgi:glycosyltransferase involved in cell wall biosynthesis